MYQLFASDLDGTLLNDNHKIPQRNKDAIKKAYETKGLKFLLCSGRSSKSLKNFEQELELDKNEGYGIAFNGCMVYELHTGKILRDIRMERKLAFDIINKLRQADVQMLVYVGNDLYAEHITDLFKSYEEITKMHINIVDSLEDITGEITKVIARDDYEKLAKLEKTMIPFCKDKCSHFFSAKELYEFSSLDGTKGHGLEFLAKYLNIPLNETIAIGDNFNDVHMIQIAGLGVAVKNAEKAVKKHASYITEATNNEGAIAEIIEKFILKKN